MPDDFCQGCHEKDALIQQLTARLSELEKFQHETRYLRDQARTDGDIRLLCGDSRAMKQVRLAIQQVAKTDSTVLIHGETGTGKELVARAIHQLSSRRNHPLVSLNCAALSPGVVASELFGHEQGAFTGAGKRRIGRFELADKGTIFLDEIGELALEMQVMLLRVMQERLIERVGASQSIPVDVRMVAATHRNLNKAMDKGLFRPDLFFRLNVFPIQVPPLRERREDIPDLVKHFLQRISQHTAKPVVRVSKETMDLLVSYHWPGNVRELQNLVERAIVVASGDTLTIEPGWLQAQTPKVADEESNSLAELERRAIIDALQHCHGRIYGSKGAAAVLKLKPTTLYGKMKKYHIPKYEPPS